MDDSQLKKHAKNIRINIIKMLTKSKSGHTGGSLGMADVFTSLYFHALDANYYTENPDRDRFILSNGHICPVWYATLAEKGLLKEEELLTLRQINSRLQGHPVNHDLKWAELPTGSLGQGVCAATGLALGYKLDGKKSRVYVGLGDGEMQEGSVWEALMFAAQKKLDNLTAFVDRNFVQQAGNTEDMIGLEPLADKIKSFGWNVIEADGHDFEKINNAFDDAKRCKDKPTFIIFRTHMGQGVSFVLDNYKWHGVAPSEEQAAAAIKELM
jgi:transketolase